VGGAADIMAEQVAQSSSMSVLLLRLATQALLTSDSENRANGHAADRATCSNDAASANCGNTY
jgi:hypothetical protein